MRQHMAQLALAEAQYKQIFHTPATSQASVLERGFVRQWDSCTIQKAQERIGNEKTLQVLVLGGPGSARPSIDCDQERFQGHEDDGYAGRYSNILERELNRVLAPGFHLNSTAKTGPEAPPFQVINMAHASLVPSVQGLVLDRLVDPETTDVIIWEHSLYDFKGSDQHDREMDFWLSRLEALFRTANRPPPPILLLHLWDELVALDNPSNTHIIGDRNVEPVIDNYREQKGWNIQVTNVGATVVQAAHKQAFGQLVDRNYHSTCRGSELIADMLAHTFYQDMASCNQTVLASNLMSLRTDEESAAKHGQTYTLTSNTFNYTRNTTLPLTELLLRKDIRTVSLNHWKPNLGVSSTHLNIPNMAESTHLLEFVPVMNTPTSKELQTAKVQWAIQKVYERLSYRLPLCANFDFVNLTIAEPTLEWLGLAYKGGRIDAFMNGEPLSLVHDGRALSGGLEGIRDWIHVGHLLSPAPSYNVSFCSRKVDKRGQSSVWLHQLVGLLLPSSSGESRSEPQLPNGF
eukprot:Sro522_g159610.1 n/a (517) ;mRNA; r:42080-43630